MRKVIFLVVVLMIAAISFSGCVTFVEDFELYEDAHQISNIQVYYTDDWFCMDMRPLNEFYDCVQPIKTIEQSYHQEIVNILQEIEYRDSVFIFMASDPVFDLHGYIIEVRYNSGARQFLSKSVTYTLDANSKVVDRQSGGIDDEIWYSLLLKCAAPEWPSLQS